MLDGLWTAGTTLQVAHSAHSPGDEVGLNSAIKRVRLRWPGGYFFGCQKGTFSIVKVLAKQSKWVLFRSSNGYFFD